MELVDDADADKNGKIDFGEWEHMGVLLQISLNLRMKLTASSR